MSESKKEYNLDDIQALTKSEWFQKRLFEEVKIDLIYVIIGYLQEYMGGYSTDEEVVDGFFVNELEKAKVFEKICVAYLHLKGSENDVVFAQNEEGFSWVKSKTICAELTKHYEKAHPDHGSSSLRKDDGLFMSPENVRKNFGGQFNHLQYSFLIGVFLRNEMVIEDQRRVVFANAGHKAQLTVEFIRNFDAFGSGGSDALHVQYYFNVPFMTHIALADENPFWKEIDGFVEKVTTDA